MSHSGAMRVSANKNQVMPGSGISELFVSTFVLMIRLSVTSFVLT